MFIIRRLFFALVLTCFSGLNVWAAEKYADLASYNFLVPESNISSDTFKLAKSTFLPETFDDLGLSGRDNTKYDFNQTDCSAYPLTGCPLGWSCDKCPFGNKWKKKSCAEGYQKSGDQCTKIPDFCTGSGEHKNIPTDNVCSKKTRNPGCNTQTGVNCDFCYSSCTKVSCSAYSLDCNTINKSQLHISETENCQSCSGSANCSKAYCKIIKCADGYKINSNGSACIEKDDTCENGYYKSCETGIMGDPKYTEKGTACYQCKPKPTCGSGQKDTNTFWCSVPASIDCSTLGYKRSPGSCGSMKQVICPFDTSKVACIDFN